VIESQYGILVEKISNTRDYEAVKVAHDHFLSALLAQSFVHMKAVRNLAETFMLGSPCVLHVFLCPRHSRIVEGH